MAPEMRQRKGTRHVPVDSKTVELREDLAKCIHSYWRRHMEYLFEHFTEHADGNAEVHHFDVTLWRRKMTEGYKPLISLKRKCFEMKLIRS